MAARKEDVITFKVDKTLAEKMQGIQNRSAFIRTAVLAALDNMCPLCNGSGVLSVEQAEHWKAFMQHHHVEKLPGSSEPLIVCDAGHSH